MAKEQIVTVYEVPEYTEGDPYLRIPINADKAASTVRIDRETGDFITLWEEKIRYPYCTKVPSKIIVKTNKRKIEFVLKLDEDGRFFWNGANIPTIFWTVLGMSKDSPYGWIASKWHDNLLYRKKEFLEELRKVDKSWKVSEFRRLTSLILRQLFINNGVNKIKACIMTWCVDCWQVVSPMWWGVK